VYQQADPSESSGLLEELSAAERDLGDSAKKRAQAQSDDPNSNGLVFAIGTQQGRRTLGTATTGLEAKVHVRMAQVPTSIYHIMDPEEHPLVTCWVSNSATKDNRIRRVRVVSFIEGYSAQAVDTIELKPRTHHEFNQLPTLFPDRVRDVTELTRAMLNVVVEDMDNNVTELHRTAPIWLLARTTAPVVIMDPKAGEWLDMSRYWGAYVTPNAQSVMKFLREVVNYHPENRLVGYQGGEEEIEPQVKAVFDALKHKADIRYVNSVVDFSPEEGASNQRIRLPKESLEDKQANCIDGTVLFASLLEGISLSPAIVVVPGHAFVAWETWSQPARKSNKWKYLETTMIGSHSFEEACNSAEQLATSHEITASLSGDEAYFRLWSLRELRTKLRITPME